MSDTRIVGICLVRNEQNFVEWSIMNIAQFCDHIIVLENNSQDETPHILRDISRRIKDLRIIQVDDAYDTHKYVEEFAGKQAWVFGVDGDEIYDSGGLARLRPRILSGEFSDYWRIVGHALHVERIDWHSKTAFGYGQPAARSITKLYNFDAITSWGQGKHQRLHGKSMQFRPGYFLKKEHNICERASWGHSDLRCLHMCFVPRSPFDGEQNRRNPSEVMKSGWLRNRLLKRLGVQRNRRSYKDRFYAKGPLFTVDISPFAAPTAVAQDPPNSSPDVVG
jgi:hypothetical protein